MAARPDEAFGGIAGTRYRLQAVYGMAPALGRPDEIRLERVVPAEGA